jgi:serine protease Do
VRIILTLLAIAVLVSPSRPVAAEPAFIGMQVQGLSAEAAAALGMEKAHGVLVRDVALGGPSAAAGFQRGDLIIRLDDKDVDTFERLIAIVGALEAGSKFQVTVLRRGKTVDLTLETGKWPVAWRANDKAFAAFPNIGLTVASMSDKLRRALGIRWGSTGVAVTLVDNSKGLPMDLKRGELILQVNQEPIWAPKQLDTRYRAAKKAGHRSLLLLVEGAAGFRFSLLPIR